MIDENWMLIGLLALVFGALAAIAALSNRGSLNSIKNKTVGDGQYAINTIAKELCLSRSSVKRAMSELIQRGKIKKRARFRENGGNTSNLYSLIV